MTTPPLPELLAPAGSLDAVRAAVANGADAVYLGANRFNARDEGAQLTLEEVGAACRLAHARGRRVYLTFNILLKPAELADALVFLGDAVALGIDAAIVQDVGVVRLIQRLYPELEIHGSTQMTIHDVSGAAVMKELGLERVVLARENTLDDVRAIRAAVPALGLETFVHGALCISYSGQCYMSGMISERSANRGSCAQSCRKEYVLTDAATGGELDRGYLISAKDLAAHDHLPALAAAGVGCLKVEGRKKRPEYVATVTKGYRTFLDRLGSGDEAAPSMEEVQPLVQIYSRGFTGGMFGGRQGRHYITRSQPDNRGTLTGVVVGFERGELLVEGDIPLVEGDGVGFEDPARSGGPVTGFSIARIRTLPSRAGRLRQAIAARTAVPTGWRVIRTSDSVLLEGARQSYAELPLEVRERKVRLDARVFGSAGSPLKVVFTVEGDTVTVRSEAPLAPAERRPVDSPQLREQLGRLGETPFALAALDVSGLAPGLFIPVSELNRLRQDAVAELLLQRDWAREAAAAAQRLRVEQAVADLAVPPPNPQGGPSTVVAEVYTIDDALAAAGAGAGEIVLDPFIRHPAPPAARVAALRDTLAARGIPLRLRTPTIVRPPERRFLQKFLDLGLPVLSGHIGLVAELARSGRDVVADYAVNCFNQHTAAELFRLGAGRITLSVELTADEMMQVTAPFGGDRFQVMLYGRPEGMTIEHCVLSAANDRTPTTCRDLCVQKHTNVELTDPAGYTFPVATDSGCRNRLLHSRPVDGAEFLPKLHAAGLRSFRVVFNVAGEPVADIVSRYREMLAAIDAGERADLGAVREVVGGLFTRGHFARAV